MNGIIRIGHSHIVENNNNAKLEAEITIDNESKMVFFEVPLQYKEGLTQKRADPFLVALINYALRTGKNIICEDSVSERLLYGISHIYIPTLVYGSSDFMSCTIDATPVRSLCDNKKLIVGAGMSFGCDSMYTLSQNGQESEYPIEFLCNFNNGVYGDNEEEKFKNHSSLVSKFAKELGIQHITVNSNIQNTLYERFLDVYSQRNFACVLALQNLLSVYLYASGHDEEKTAINPNNSALYDVVSVDCFSTENLSILLSGCECTRVEKLKKLSNFKPAFEHLHPCFKHQTNLINCGHCKKDIRDMITLYSLGIWRNFKNVYDWNNFEQKIPMHLAFLISKEDDHLYKEALDVWLETGHQIPRQSFTYADILKKVLNKKGESDELF